MHGHGNTVLHGRVADLVRLEDSARGGEIGMNLAHGVRLAQLDEIFLQVDIFAGERGGGAFRRDALPQVSVLPGDHILHPGKVVFLISLSQPDAGVHADVAEVVHGKRDFHPNGFADRGNVLAEHAIPLSVTSVATNG